MCSQTRKKEFVIRIPIIYNLYLEIHLRENKTDRNCSRITVQLISLHIIT